MARETKSISTMPDKEVNGHLSSTVDASNESSGKTPIVRFAIPKKGRLYARIEKLLKGI